MEITVKKIRRNNIYAVVANGVEYILNAHWDDESLTGSVTDTKTGNCWFFVNVTDFSEYRHEAWAKIVNAYVKWAYRNE